MRLEDATKDELVWWIKKKQFAFGYELQDFPHDILFRRHDVYLQKAKESGDRFVKASEKHGELLGPYEGRPISEIPGHVLRKAAALETEMIRAIKAQRKAWMEADRCMKKIMSESDTSEKGGG